LRSVQFRVVVLLATTVHMFRCCLHLYSPLGRELSVAFKTFRALAGVGFAHSAPPHLFARKFASQSEGEHASKIPGEIFYVPIVVSANEECQRTGLLIDWTTQHNSVFEHFRPWQTFSGYMATLRLELYLGTGILERERLLIKSVINLEVRRLPSTKCLPYLSLFGVLFSQY
jgi:hypothetical protein